MRAQKIISALAASALTLGALSLGVFAEDEPAGYIYFMAEKSVIGQGFTVQPEKVAFYEGETGLDVVKRAADVLTDDTGYGAYITAFADEDLKTEIPSEISAVVPEMSGRNTEGYLSAYDYTSESGWTYFINDEYAQVGISDYVPTDGDVVVFSFTVYGYGADLGVDNSSWGGAAALITRTNKSELIKLCAEASEDDFDEYDFTYTAAMEALAIYNAPQEDIDNAAAALEAFYSEDTAESADTAEAADTAEVNDTAEAAETAETADTADAADTADTAETAAADKGSPDTGAEGVAVAVAAVIIAGAGIALSRKK